MASEDGTGTPPEDDPAAAATGGGRRRTQAEIDAIFGDDLPSTTRDERGRGARDPGKMSESDRWHLRNVPPHHG